MYLSEPIASQRCVTDIQLSNHTKIDSTGSYSRYIQFKYMKQVCDNFPERLIKLFSSQLQKRTKNWSRFRRDLNLHLWVFILLISTSIGLLPTPLCRSPYHAHPRAVLVVRHVICIIVDQRKATKKMKLKIRLQLYSLM